MTRKKNLPHQIVEMDAHDYAIATLAATPNHLKTNRI